MLSGEQTCLDPASPPASPPFPPEHETRACHKGPEEANDSPGSSPDSLLEEEKKVIPGKLDKFSCTPKDSIEKHTQGFFFTSANNTLYTKKTRF